MNIHNKSIINLIVFDRCGKFNSQPCQPICLNWFSAQTSLAEMPRVVSRTRLINPNQNSTSSWFISLKTEGNGKRAFTKQSSKTRKKIMIENPFHYFIHRLARGWRGQGFIPKKNQGNKLKDTLPRSIKTKKTSHHTITPRRKEHNNDHRSLASLEISEKLNLWPNAHSQKQQQYSETKWRM